MSAASVLDDSVAPEPSALAAFVAVFLSRPAVIAATLVILVFITVALFAPWLAPYDPLAQSFIKINRPPSAEHWLGTDQFGRDVLSRMIFGSRNSLIIGFLAPTLAASVGTTLGVMAGYFGGTLDRIISRFIDLLISFPELLLAIIISAALGGGFWNIVIVLAAAFVPGFARVARAQTMAVKHEPFVEAAVAVGLRTPKIILRHIVPNIAAPVVALVTLWTASAIRLEASLSFLGLGTQAPNPSWGNIIRDGLNNLFGSPWPIIGAGLAITLVVLSLNLFGDALRDFLDPDTAQ